MIGKKYTGFLTVLSWMVGVSAQANFFTPTSVAELIADINTANTNGEIDVIDLGHKTFTLDDSNQANDLNDGINGLPSILSDGGFSLTIQNGIIQRDTSSSGFRHFRVTAGAYLILRRVELSNGLANVDDFLVFPGNGGGSILNEGNLAIYNSTLTNNSSISATVFGDAGGGAIYNYGGVIVNIYKSNFVGNSSAANFGGAIQNNLDVTGTILGNIISIEKTGFSGNQAAIGGGAIANFASIDTIKDSTFASNSAGGGGAVYNGINTILETIVNSTFSANSAVGGEFVSAVGGAISNSGAITNIDNTTFAENSALERGGAISTFAANIENFISNIAALNTAPNGPDLSNVGGSFGNASYNLVGTDGGSHGIVNGTNNNQVGTDASPLDPMIGPLAGNGGVTLTRALLTTSPAINAGANPLALQFDQRGPGYIRSRMQTDIGAFEVQSHGNAG